MGLCGIMAWRSVLDGNRPKEVPDFRIPAIRNKYRHDNACCTPEIAGKQLLPNTSFEPMDIPDETFDNVREIWLGNKKSPLAPLFYTQEELNKTDAENS